MPTSVTTLGQPLSAIWVKCGGKLVQDTLLRTSAQLSFSFDGNEIKYDRLWMMGHCNTLSCDIEIDIGWTWIMTLNRHRVDFCKIIESPNTFGLTKTELKLAIGYKPTKTPLSLLLANVGPMCPRRPKLRWPIVGMWRNANVCDNVGPISPCYLGQYVV